MFFVFLFVLVMFHEEQVKQIVVLHHNDLQILDLSLII